MRSFFKVFFASLSALIVFVILAFFILIGIASAVASADKPDIGKKGVLVLDLTKTFKEQEDKDPLNMISGNTDNTIPGLYDVVRLIEHAKDNDNIRGLYIKCDDNANGFAASEELRNAVLDFKTSKKFVVAYGDYISQKGYLVGSAANRIYCNPIGNVEWLGFETTLMFFKGTLEKLQIEPQIFYAGKFKSATEPLRAYEMSEPNKVQVSAYLSDLYSRLLLSAQAKTGTDTAVLHNLANNGVIQTAHDAVKYKLIDAVKYDDEVKGEILQLLKEDEAHKINFVSLGKYYNAVDLSPSKGDRIAIIYAEGEIVDGKGDDGVIGSDKYRNIIRKVRLDNKIKAIVFRISSPGGSVIASEEIWRELSLAKKKKPVVVSFGDVAASGGYYVSCNADSIFAQPSTITGSIGVFGIIPNMKNFFNNKLGITFDGVKTSPYADMLSVSRPLNSAESKFIQNSIDTFYQTFKVRVATGRNLPLPVVDSIAQGRVWTGQRALQLKLVDRLGDIEDAIACAARMAKLDSYNLREYPEKRNFIEEFFDKYSENVKVRVLKEEIGEEQYEVFKQLKSIKGMIATPQARLPYAISVH